MSITVTYDKGRAKFDKEATHFGYIKGTAQWAKILQPGEYGSYEVDLYPDEETLEHFKSIAGPICDESKEAIEGLGKKVSGIADFIKDKDGKEYIKFKLPAEKYDGTPQKPVVVDAGGTTQPDWDQLIGNGSIVKLKYWMSPYYMASSKAVGVSLKFNAIQVIKLEEYAGGDTGFGDESGDQGFDTGTKQEDF